MFKKKVLRPLRQLFSESFQYLITNTNVFPDPEEVNVDGLLSVESVDHLVFDELVLAFIIMRLEIGAKGQFKHNLRHVHEEFMAGLIDALNEFQGALPVSAFLDAVGSYERVLDFDADITEQLVTCFDVFSSRLSREPAPGYSPLLTLVKFVRLQVIRPLIKTAESQFQFE